ncbi:MAG: hypothetical protein ACLTFJ_12840 [Clostridium sp.]
MSIWEDHGGDPEYLRGDLNTQIEVVGTTTMSNEPDGSGYRKLMDKERESERTKNELSRT